MRNLALDHSARCFWNSYVRDMKPPYDAQKKSFVITLPEGKLHVGTKRLSLLGVHEYENDFYFSHSPEEKMSFSEAARVICQGQPLLHQRLLNSIDNITSSLETRGDSLKSFYSGNVSFVQAEQALLVGHSFHPTPKSRDEFSDQDVRDFSPEYAAEFALLWILVSEDVLWKQTSKQFVQAQWPGDLYPQTVPAGYVALPMHPWQWKTLQASKIIADYLKRGLIARGEEQSLKWTPTSSMRSLYAESSPWMIKFSMSVRLTNSLRHLQVNEVGRGMLLQDIFATSKGEEFFRRYPYFHLMHEPACFALKDESGKVMPETMVLLRENPFLNDDATCVVLATLNQDHPLGDESLMAICLNENDPQFWFSQFMNLVVEPILMAQADYGVMLGAHQQNLVIKLKEGRPAGAYFRDCQGTGLSLLGVENFSKELQNDERLLQNFVPSESAQALFIYYLIINSVFNTIHAVAKASDFSESKLIKIFRDKLVHLSTHVRDPSIINHLLTSPELLQKGNFRCSLLNLNENTSTDPLSIYNSVPNPFFEETLS